jgi:hypothetical protein
MFLIPKVLVKMEERQVANASSSGDYVLRQLTYQLGRTLDVVNLFCQVSV